jgi:hypothetical protein
VQDFLKSYLYLPNGCIEIDRVLCDLHWKPYFINWSNYNDALYNQYFYFYPLPVKILATSMTSQMCVNMAESDRQHASTMESLEESDTASLDLSCIDHGHFRPNLSPASEKTTNHYRKAQTGTDLPQYFHFLLLY